MKVGRPITPVRGFVPRSVSRTDSGVESGKAQLLETMLSRGLTQELEGARPAQKELLRSALGRVDRGLLLWADQQGVRLQVLQSGEELEEAEVLRDLHGRFEERMKPETVELIHRHLSPLSDQIRAEKDSERALSLRRRKRAQLAELLTENPCGGAVFTPAFAPLLAPGLSRLSADPTETPTLKGMALHHGADSPEEQKQFYSWMERLNGPRLQEAREATIEEKSRLLKERPEALERWLQQARDNPETVPLDTTLFTLVVPDAHFLPSTTGKDSVLIDRSDVRSVEGWRNGDFRGQWFFLEGKANLLIRDSALELDTAVHELGHVIDMTLEKREPDFYRSLGPRIEKAHYQARLHGHAITSYAMANTREYIAEGFAAYYNEPGKLRQKDPELYDLVDTMVEYCCDKAGANRGLDRRLEKMWREVTSTDPSLLNPQEIRQQFDRQLTVVPKADALSQSAMDAALSASRLGLLAGASDVALGLGHADSPPSQMVADSIQQAYANGLTGEDQKRLFELAYRHGRAL